jgi:hypothetical protein
MEVEKPTSTGAYSAIGSLPIELLDQILAEVVAAERSSRTTLMRVSRLWYTAIIQQPNFWNRVNLSLALSESCVEIARQTIEASVARSGTLDLDISLEIGEDTGKCDCTNMGLGQQCLQQLEENRRLLDRLAGCSEDSGNSVRTARWRHFRMEMDAIEHRNDWMVRVLEPFFVNHATPRLRVLRIQGNFDNNNLCFHDTPLLEEVELQYETSIHIGHVNLVRKLSFTDAPPPRLGSKAFGNLTHLGLNLPIRSSGIELPVVTRLDILDDENVDLVLDLPILPRVKFITITTNMDDFYPEFSLSQYPTVKFLCLRYSVAPLSPVPEQLSNPLNYLSALKQFLSNQCDKIEILEVDPRFESAVQAVWRQLPKLKGCFMMGQRIGQRMEKDAAVSVDVGLLLEGKGITTAQDYMEYMHSNG